MIDLLPIEKELRKGVLGIILLKTVSKERLYGYEIMNRISDESCGYFDLKEGTLYPVLYRLEDEKLIESSWGEDTSKRGARRKYYTITDAGTEKLETYQRIWKDFSEKVDKILYGGNANG